jgi:hypothetical protein
VHHDVLAVYAVAGSLDADASADRLARPWLSRISHQLLHSEQSMNETADSPANSSSALIRMLWEMSETFRKLREIESIRAKYREQEVTAS